MGWDFTIMDLSYEKKQPCRISPTGLQLSHTFISVPSRNRNTKLPSWNTVRFSKTAFQTDSSNVSSTESVFFNVCKIFCILAIRRFRSDSAASSASSCADSSSYFALSASKSYPPCWMYSFSFSLTATSSSCSSFFLLSCFFKQFKANWQFLMTTSFCEKYCAKACRNFS